MTFAQRVAGWYDDFKELQDEVFWSDSAAAAR